MGSLYLCSLSFVIFIYSDVTPQSTQRILESSHVPDVYVSPKVVHCRLVQSGCLHYMPRGVSNTSNHMHVALLYYIGTGALYHSVTYLAITWPSVVRFTDTALS